MNFVHLNFCANKTLTSLYMLLILLAIVSRLEAAPGFLSQLSPKEVRALVAQEGFVSSEQHLLATPLPPGSATHREVYEEGNSHENLARVSRDLDSDDEEDSDSDWEVMRGPKMPRDYEMSSHKFVNAEANPFSQLLQDTPGWAKSSSPDTSTWAKSSQQDTPSWSALSPQDTPSWSKPLAQTPLFSSYTLTPKVLMPDIYGQLFQPLLNNAPLSPFYSQSIDQPAYGYPVGRPLGLHPVNVYEQQPLYGQQQPYTQTLYSQPAYGQQPTFGQPLSLRPVTQPTQSQSPYAQSTQSQSPYAQSTQGQPPYTQSTQGQPPYTQSTQGQPPYTQSTQGQLPFGQMSSLYTQPQPAQSGETEVKNNAPEDAAPPVPISSATPPLTQLTVPTQPTLATQPAQPYDPWAFSQPQIAASLGDRLGHQVGTSLGSSLASEMNLLHGLTNSAAENFLSVFGSQLRRPAAPTQETDTERRLQAVNLSALLGTLLSGAGTVSTEGAEESVSATLATTSTTTVKPAAAVWNEAIDTLQETASNLGLPSVSGYNASLPVIDTIGYGSEVAALSQQAGSNVGSAIGQTLGNSVASTADLWKALFGSVTSSFVDTVSPSIGDLATLFSSSSDTGGRRLSAHPTQPTHPRRKLANTTGCVEYDTLYESPMSIAFNDVPNAKTCNLICQTYSSPATIMSDSCLSSTATSQDLPCLWTTYAQLTHRCTLLFSLANHYTLEGFVSQPVFCEGSSVIQTETASTHLTQQGCDITHLVVPDSAKPPAPSERTVEIPDFPKYENTEETGVWRHNPEPPLAQSDLFEYDVFYQVGYGVSNVMESKVWGQSSGVKDWRECVWLCHRDETCQYWTYSFDPLTYENRKGACYLATSQEPKGAAVSRVKTISGSRLSSFNQDLFGDVMVDTGVDTGADTSLRRLYVPDPKTRSWKPVRRLTATTTVSSIMSPQLMEAYGLESSKYLAGTEVPTVSSPMAVCQDTGFAYYTSETGVAIGGVDVDSVTLCETACSATDTCVAYQYVPHSVVSASSAIQLRLQNVSCVLLSQTSRVAHVSIPSMVSGVRPTDGVCLTSQKPEKPSVSAVPLPVVEDDSDDSHTHTLEDTTCVSDADSSTHQFAIGISTRGQLIDTHPNVLRGVTTPRVCHTECVSRDDCTAFTWGVWQGCYLLSTVEAFVADGSNQVVSGYADCHKNSDEDVSALSTEARRLTSNEPRSLTTCARAYKGLVYTQGSIVGNDTQAHTADECWTACRETHDCFYMTYLSLEGNVCVLFDQIAESQEVQTSIGTSAEVNCDVLGDLAFESTWAASRVMRDINVPLVAGATAGATGGLLLLVGGGYLVWRKRRVSSSQTVSDKTETVPSTNAFGMSVSMSPNGASPGAMERCSPALQLDDFEKVDPGVEKSTGKRLRRYF
eukprot:Blabericola_migrator_1__5903@NODE_298_length_10203_cov_353_110695_g245_i0_p1_GENE_NODE_298_length_10203_cov_353_110695_g245_i0NODE_298_length_10203_cov_353_110695_g245_i0_p1_ORF_typecomplete_len1407_score349_61PAN_4/PF14295_6/0_00032PAN_4/PF14295_6/0_0005PAN_4/PF14295_6/0_02PAN_4/PF14295_6/0_00029PAN_1/PF00024_26/50PAN_1/PF00024_26/0_015PAN_1/PF00024_26/0_00034PAN_1/PF00024_26/0_0065PAN_1/PF00024_26/0_049PAN_3/PF08277_12/1_7e04PAN_3/PF08277_12/0_065PAN_3/PF08277_12/1e02PAN_3/PF08277_12/3PAN_3/PF